MNKFVKRTLAVVLALAMTFALTACGGKQNSGSSGDYENWVIDYNTWGAGTATFDFMADVTEAALDAFGISGYTRASDDNMADKELQNIQNFISAEVNGIIMQTTAEPVLPTAAEECEKAGIPFVLATFTGADADREAIRENNSVYVGAVAADKYTEGYIIGKAAAEDGHKTAVMLGGNVGDNHMEMRIAGFTQAFVTEGGGKILDEARCASPAEGQAKANDMLSATPDADCLFAMVGDYVPGAINAMETLDLDIPVYVTNANTDAIPYIRDGSVAAATTGNDLVSAVAAALLINYLDGHPILDHDGKPPELSSVGFEVNQDNVDDYERLFLNNMPLTETVLQSLVYRCNPDVDYDYIVDFLDNHLTMEALAADQG